MLNSTSSDNNRCTSTLLPPEIWSHVLDHLYDEKATLTNCVLVCREWATSTRYHLFSSVKIDLSSEKIVQSVTSDLWAPNSTIIPLIRRIEFHGGNHQPQITKLANRLLEKFPILPSLDSLALTAHTQIFQLLSYIKVLTI